MGLVQSKWEIEECRSEDGIFFSDDTVVLLAGSPSKGYQVSGRQRLDALMEANPDGWTTLDVGCSTVHQSLLILGGGGSYESDGFLAVVDAINHRLIWLLHLAGAERFTDIHVNASIIQAVSEEYPFRHEWKVPLENPHELVVNTREDS